MGRNTEQYSQALIWTSHSTYCEPSGANGLNCLSRAEMMRLEPCATILIVLPDLVTRLLFRRKLLVFSLAHKSIQILDTLLRNLNLSKPSSGARVLLSGLVDGTWLLLQQAIDLRDRACNGRVDIRSRLDRLYSSNGIAS